MSKSLSKFFLVLPNLLSFYRIVLGFIFPFIWWKNVPVGLIMLLMISGALSDVLDGYFARHYNTQTNFGKIIDPVADKIFINVLFFLFYLDKLVSLDFILIIFLRDILILLGATFLYAKSSGKIDFHPSYLGKLCTAFQLLFLIIYFIHIFVIKFDQFFVFILYQVVLFLVFASGFHYLLLFRKLYKTLPIT